MACLKTLVIPKLIISHVWFPVICGDKIFHRTGFLTFFVTFDPKFQPLEWNPPDRIEKSG
jgi:hypothetical protein